MRADGRRSSRSPAGSSRARTGRRRPRAAEEHFTRVVRQHEAPGRGAGRRAPGRRPGPSAGAARRSRSASRSTSEARRLIEQGGVKLDGEAVERARRAARALAGALLQVGKRRFGRLVDGPTRLTRGARYTAWAVLTEQRTDQSQPRRPRSLQGPTRIRYESLLWRPLARVGGFFSPSVPSGTGL